MAELKTINLEAEKIYVTLAVTKQEYDLLKEDTKNLVVLPAAKLNEVLTTGRIGNGNRIMLPNKVLKRNEIKELFKHVNARIFDADSKKLLLIKLEDNKRVVPNFKR